MTASLRDGRHIEPHKTSWRVCVPADMCAKFLPTSDCMLLKSCSYCVTTLFTDGSSDGTTDTETHGLPNSLVMARV